jgi:hypothetical protein
MEELFNERAAIREYLGGFNRKEAEILAREDLREILNDKNTMANF